MNAVFHDWPWAVPANHTPIANAMPQNATLTADLLGDLTLPSSSSSLTKQPNDASTLFSFDDDKFSCLDDFILYPDDPSEELRLFESPLPRQGYMWTKAETQLSPISSITESLPSPAASQIESAGSNSPQHLHTTDDSVNHQPNRRRRRNSTVFPCSLCERVCYTSVEARRHHARHVKPFHCPEPMVHPLQSQSLYPTRSTHAPPTMSPSSTEPMRCDKAFATKNELERHRKSVHYCVPECGPKEWFSCPIDGCKIAERLWPRRDNLLVHMKQAHPGNVGTELRVFNPERGDR